MLKVAVLVSGGGTNLQAILDAIDEGRITNARVDVVISNNPGAYALELARGVKVTGATVHFVDEGTDTGPIILQKPVAVEEGDTPEILQRRVMEQAEWIILPQAIDLIANGRVSVANGHVTVEK